MNDVNPNVARIISSWSDEELARELRNPERMNVPHTYPPLLAEALARLLDASAGTNYCSNCEKYVDVRCGSCDVEL